MRKFGYYPTKLKEVSDQFVQKLKNKFGSNEFQESDVKKLLWDEPFKIHPRLVNDILGKYRVRYSEVPVVGRVISGEKIDTKNPKYSDDALKSVHRNHRYAKQIVRGKISRYQKFENELVDSHYRQPHIEVFCIIKKQENWDKVKKERLDYARPFDMYKDCISSNIDLLVSTLLRNEIKKLPASLHNKLLQVKDTDIEVRNRKIKSIRKLMVDIEKSKPEPLVKHLKILLLDLISLWSEDPEKNFSVSRSSNTYTKQSIYNTSQVTTKLLTVLDAMWQLNYLKYDRGIRNVDDAKKTWNFTRKSRYSLTNKFIERVILAKGIKNTHIFSIRNKPNLILRERKYDEYLKQTVNSDIEYKENKDTKKMSKELCAYNNLLRKSFIDIPDFPKDGLKTRNPNRNITVNFEDENHKFVRRVFNDGSLKSGGRYYGGWWQRLSPEWRQQIRIDGKPVVEYDYSGMHIVLLYALRGIDYWKDINKDPFDLSEYGYVNDEQMRNLLKVILNCYVNVEKGKKKSETHAKKAVEFVINSNHDYYSWTKDYIDVDQLMDDFCLHHELITRYFFVGKGIPFHKIDSFVAESVVNKLTKKGIPVLCMNDSFVVPFDTEGVDSIVRSSYQKITKQELKVNAKIKEEGGVEYFWNNILGKKMRDSLPKKVKLPPIKDKKYLSRSKKFEKKVTHKKFIEKWYQP